MLTLDSDGFFAVDEPRNVGSVFKGSCVGGFVFDPLSPGRAKVYFKR
ncbi:MAG: hypothetical protein O3C68_04790 [Proteobacteria bacterium]|nr:hypothetical protein [Pseudomonadota bacterium]